MHKKKICLVFVMFKNDKNTSFDHKSSSLIKSVTDNKSGNLMMTN